jgi:hypothetical protein
MLELNGADAFIQSETKAIVEVAGLMPPQKFFQTEYVLLLEEK